MRDWAVVQLIGRTLRIAVQNWPALIAIFLAGWLARFLLIRLAGYLGTIDAVFGMLVLALAVLVRLASYVAMFLIVRRSMPAFLALDEAVDPDGAGPASRRFREALGSSILAFFVVYAAWKMMETDFIDYAQSYLEQFPFGDEDAAERATGLDIQLAPVTIAIVVVAFLLRLLVKRLAKRLPSWSSYLAVYLEAVWIFVALAIIKSLLEGVPAWLESRRISAWLIDTINAAKDAFAPFRFLWDGASWLIAEAGTTIVLPLAWLTLAGIVYAKALANSDALAPPPVSRLNRARDGYQRLPGFFRKGLAELAGDFVERWRPISTSARLIWNAGAIAMGGFILAYAVLEVSRSWLHYGFYQAMGPHELAWWFAADIPVTLLFDAIVEPLRICLVAAAYDLCLRRLGERSSVALRVRA